MATANERFCIISETRVFFFFRQHKLYNKELYADFIAAQIKTLSFLAYIIRIYQVHLLDFDMLHHFLLLKNSHSHLKECSCH